MEHLTVFIEDLLVQARVGVHDHERGGAQPLQVSIEIELRAARPGDLAETVDYGRVAEAARRIAVDEHIDLIETFAAKLLDVCLDEPAAVSAQVTVRKPRALSGGMAGVRLSGRAGVRRAGPDGPVERRVQPRPLMRA